MRLLHVRNLEFQIFYGNNLPPYVIASHRWGNQEAIFSQFARYRIWRGEGYAKVAGFCRFVQRIRPDISWLWLDSCCIDKTNDAELSEAINSMFRWYRSAELCVAYLSDISPGQSIRDSVWFRRGWTLQELLAPRTVIFVSRDWQIIGEKCARASLGSEDDSSDDDNEDSGSGSMSANALNDQISRITGIPTRVLADFDRSRSLTVRQRLRWMRGRDTTKDEDYAYSLLGIFGVFMPLIYGEGAAHAIRRLRDQIALESQYDRFLDLSRPEPLPNQGGDSTWHDLLQEEMLHQQGLEFYRCLSLLDLA